MKEKEKVRKWFQGPGFPRKEEITWPRPNINTKVDTCDPEIRNQTRLLVKKQENDVLSCLVKATRSWWKVKGILALVILFIQEINVEFLKD